MMTELHNTVMGKRLIEHTLPDIAYQLKRIADLLEEDVKKNRQDAELIKAAKAYIENSKIITHDRKQTDRQDY